MASQRMKKGDGRQVGFGESPSSSLLAAKAERTVVCEENEKLARRERRHRLRR